MKKSGIYMIQNSETKDTYVGSTRNLRHRKIQHFSLLRKGEHENRRLQKSFNQSEESCFDFVILEDVENKDDLCEREQFWLDTLKPSLNILLTANNNTLTRTAALEEKYKKHSEIMSGRTASEETRQKMSESHLLHWSDPENRKKLKKTDEQKEHFRILSTGERNPNWGKPRPDETRRKISDGNARKIRVGFVSPDGVEFSPVTNLGWFCKEHELNYWAMNDIDKGERVSYKGWTKIP